MNDSVAGTQDALGRWVGSIPAEDVIANLCMGKSTRVQVIMQRTGKTHRREIGVNHLGIGEAASWMRK
jgi:hypothetical protein